ncbi:hypothetical protein HHI36_023759 [Cryptolaemus montrouzieri]|uniref:Uncharacterized protein n=1 Tax=Cryptolaemus montrouzieri TaxID=559131 RepID=A0ABD2PHU1_9CUCU
MSKTYELLQSARAARRRSSGDEEVTVQEEVVPKLALPEANGDDTQPAPQATEPKIPVVVPTIVVSPPLDPSSA